MAFGVWMILATLGAAGCLAAAGQLAEALAVMHARDACTAVNAALGPGSLVWSRRHRDLGDGQITGLVLACRTLTLVVGVALAMAYVSAAPHGAHGVGPALLPTHA